MSFKEKLIKYQSEAFMKKNGDRITQVQGNAVSVKVEEKTILWIFHKLVVTILVRPDRSKSIVKCVFRRNRWFKKPEFMSISQGNLLVVQGLKPTNKKKKTNGEAIEIMNVRNLSTKKDLVQLEGKAAKVQKTQKVQRYK